ncbi:MAG: proteasome activator [Actinomycetota bacterium]
MTDPGGPEGGQPTGPTVSAETSTASPLQAVPVAAGEHPGPEDESREAITEPGKLLRIASMVRELLEETRGAPLDERSRTRLRQIYERSVTELRDVLPDELERELQEFILPLEGVPTESEMRVAQAQLVGWLEGLFHGIQAAVVAQQQAAMQQLQELRRRGLPTGMIRTEVQPPGEGEARPGQYL